jgi:hypothetical protein
MAVDQIRYDLLTQQALRGVVRSVLADAAKNGLPGEHHFYIAFDTKAPGVRLSARLREQYPEEMTIILQHQFWDLAVGQDGFEVGLSFGGIPERLGVPFEAIKGFFDPSVQFGMQFEADTESAGEPAGTKQPDKAIAKPERPLAVAGPAEAKSEPPETGTGEQPASGAEVVRLDRFRKK